MVHCARCEKCIQKFDHHCIWLNNCIEKKNYRFFIVFVFFVVLNCLVGIFSIFFVFVYDRTLERFYLVFFGFELLVVILIFFFTNWLLFFHFFIFFKGMTTYQFLKRKLKINRIRNIRKLKSVRIN